MDDTARHERHTASWIQFALFFGAVGMIAMSTGVHESVFNNFLSENFSVSPKGRGALEFPRELPGFLVVFMTGALAAVSVTRLGMTGAAILAVGMFGMAFASDSYLAMALMMTVGSAGMHLMMPVSSAIAIGLGSEHNRGMRLAQLRVVRTLGMLAGSGMVWLIFSHTSLSFMTCFIIGSVCAGLGAAYYWGLHIPSMVRPRSRMVLRRRYNLYYALELLFGARKQIFITFGPWVLINIYDQKTEDIAMLFMTSATLGLVFHPLTGWAIDRLGERLVLVADGLFLFIVCMGYGFALDLTGDMNTAILIARGCFVLDHLLFALGSGRSVYVSRLTPNHQELTSTLAMGVSINHIASMVIPFLGGALWAGYDYRYVFVGAALLALTISIVATRVDDDRSKREAEREKRLHPSEAEGTAELTDV